MLMLLLMWQGTAPVKTMLGPGVISSAAGADAATFSPDGNLVVFDRPPTVKRSVLMIARREKGKWLQPQVAPFSGKWYDQDPAMAPDGSYLIFVSDRETVKGKGVLWKVARRGAGWGEPERLPAVVNANPNLYSPSVAEDGSIYYTSGGHDYVCARRNGRYLPAERIEVPGMDKMGDPAIAPDQSFLVFTAIKDGRGDLYLSRRKDGHWTRAIDLETSSDGDSNWDVHLGPGARRAYFSSQRGGEIGVWSIDLAGFKRGRNQAKTAGGGGRG